LIHRNEDASKRIFVVTGILMSDFKLFVVERNACYEELFECPALLVTEAVNVLHPDKEESALCGRR